MERSRMEAFSDGVLAIIITIMVLGLKVPDGTNFSDIMKVLPQVGIYALSFAFIGAYWNNHHHTLHALTQVNGKILWANLLFLFVISLLPFATEWFGRNPLAPVPTFMYGVVMFATALSFFLLRVAIVTQDKNSHALRQVMEEVRRGTITGVVYIIAIGLSMRFPAVSVVLYLILLLLWFMPDRELERILHATH
ncbi:MAG: TMEM175 family protein, partial [Eubacterium sp.]|nr:TMEM175 family protein [Eubacterium sp.]